MKLIISIGICFPNKSWLLFFFAHNYINYINILSMQHLNDYSVAHRLYKCIGNWDQLTIKLSSLRLFDTRTMQVVHSYPRKHYIQMACDVSADGLHCITCSNGFGGNGCEVTVRRIIKPSGSQGQTIIQIRWCSVLPIKANYIYSVNIFWWH